MSTTSPRDLSDACARIGHDSDALEVIYRAHVRDVERFVARRTRDPFVVADLTADVFVRAIESAATYRPDAGRPVAWLLGIARHVVAAHHRAVGQEGEAVRRIEGRALVDADAYERLQEQIDAAARARALHDGLAALPDALRDVVELVVVDDLPLTQVAEVLGITSVAARVRLHRARVRLRQSTPASPGGLT
ncbi:RNA polymerase, sigma-24 subunit, ECF subfamily [Cellulomonas flavigena DSM 20109]|uniref:RNA polymerase, sigma-24 subunit, ECF subfamily n=1 Tax=Cellulomonas flavigena (strain ATCC 482 / DSM 20109 / BCRC 11376 / JCM 18109 / NBRC 3775 / NCIMB 8073 / NRS 134) TaxID=446466 RepID=D5UDN3_CELFN|nr:sigma-70 family RNA polymerase sigma factor [Cellulomonas flavigena]ADG76489.1 RNA polymerase, sigma-24 subunit, ECF subfamily [Cellulomonas flavigena DSM 20109]